MRIPDRRRFGLVLGITAVAAVAATGPLWGAHVGRRIEWLAVREVEISGTRLLTPEEVLAASGIRLGDHLLDEAAAWEAALLAHPVIAAAHISRRPPHTIRIRVEEEVPVAFVTEETLRLATATGEILPVDPHRTVLDLPIVHGSFADSASAASARAMLAEAGRLTAIAPGLVREVSTIRPYGDGDDALLLDHADAEVVVPIGVPAVRIEELRRVIADLEHRFPASEGSSRRAKHRLDLRFEEQVVVRPSSHRERS